MENINMDEDENDLENIFEDYEADNEHIISGNNEENNDMVANDISNETQTAERVPVPKRIVKNPRLKFNAERLCGERGIPVVVNHFKDIKFKGKGHEVEDLNKLISTLEHWCHRLYPSMKLDDCLRQIEKLGKKRPVQTCLRKIRMDMPILSSDFVHEEAETEENQTEMDIELPPQDAFDRLIGETSNMHLISTPLVVRTSAQGEQSLGTYSSILTDEQKKRMEYNKLLATERRKSRLTAMQSGDLNDRNQETSVLQDSAVVDLTVEEPNSGENASLYKSFNSVANGGEEELKLDDLIDLVDEDVEEG